MAKQKTPPPQQAQGKKAGKEQKTEKLFDTGDGALARITPRLRTHYEQVVRPQLQQQFNYKNPMQIPRLEKIVVNMGVGKGEQEPKQLENAVRDLALITGQKPVITVAKQAISNFRLRQGHRIGCKVTLRGDRMYIFMEKLINVVLPRIRDFAGISPRSFDGRGNYSMGLREQILFPEIVYDQVDRLRGMDITFCTSAKTDEEAFALLKAMGMPFRK
ncbi:MAG: 50S ribosomal protein L5 [Fimbriimonadales bacterium]|nr:MAG: 50S ribosomal protein L5 [Fimbriimonadales bacterium]GIV09239.1 MAG: 50S ribosomal protein L5 [Fimbriimonadales bacterium]